MRKAIITILSLFLIIFIHAEPVRTKSFKYYKDVTAVENSADSIYGVINLDDEIYQYFYGNDLRLMYENTALPYFLSEQQSRYKQIENTPSVIYNQLLINQGENEKRVYILKFPEILESSEYIKLDVQVLNADNYEINLTLTVSSDLKSWEKESSQTIFKYTGKENNVLNLSLKNNEYLRLETDPQYRLIFPKSVYIPKKYEEYSTEIPLQSLETSRNKDRNTTIYSFSNEQHKKINQIILKFREKRFERLYEIHKKYKKKYIFSSSGTIRQDNDLDKITIINLTHPVTEAIKLIISDKDNEPLNLESFIISGPKEVLIFSLPADFNQNTPLRLYYGNPYLKYPSYDISRTYDKSKIHTDFTVSGHMVNKDFSYSIIEPPVSLWIIRVLFILGLIGLIPPTYFVIKKLAISNVK